MLTLLGRRYGDFAPHTTAGRAIVCGTIILSVIVFPFQINKLSELLHSHSRYRYTYRPRRDEVHVILTGFIKDTSTVKLFLLEFQRALQKAPIFNTTYATITVVGADEPTNDLKHLVSHPMFEGNVRYIRASLLSEEDLERVSVRTAVACFIMSNKLTSTPLDEDAQSVLRALMVTNLNPRIDTVIQVHRPMETALLESTGTHHVVCIDQIKYALIGRNARSPGIAAIISNMLAGGSRVGSEDESEYVQGLRMKLHAVRLSKHFAGMTFSQCAQTMYYVSAGDVILIAIESYVAEVGDSNPPTCDLHVNPPYEFRIADNDHGPFNYQYVAYVLTTSMQQAKSFVTYFMQQQLMPVPRQKSPFNRQVSFEVKQQRPLSKILELRKKEEEYKVRKREKGVVTSDNISSTTRLVRTSVANEIRFRGHVIVCGAATDSIAYEFLLRALCDGYEDNKPVVILFPAPSLHHASVQELVESIKDFPNTCIVVGDPLDPVSLTCAGIEWASMCVLLGNRASTVGVDGKLLDVQLIQRFLCMAQHTSKRFLELTDPTQCKQHMYFTVDATTNSTFRVIDKTFIKYLQMQQRGKSIRRSSSYSSRHLESVNEDYAARNESQSVMEVSQHTEESLYAAGFSYCDETIDYLTVASFFNPQVLSLMEMLLLAKVRDLSDSSDENPQQELSRLHMVPVPGDLKGVPFGKVFEVLLERHGFISIALYRRNQGQLPYVFTGACAT
jgi:hypothetical protein